MCACGKNTDHLEDEEGGRKHPAEESYIWKKKKFYFDGRQNKTIRPVFSGQPSLMLFLGKSGEAGTPDGLGGGGFFCSLVSLSVSVCSRVPSKFGEQELFILMRDVFLGGRGFAGK